MHFPLVYEMQKCTCFKKGSKKCCQLGGNGFLKRVTAGQLNLHEAETNILVRNQDGSKMLHLRNYRKKPMLIEQNQVAMTSGWYN